jgi:predicted nucleic acid-binding protein
MSVGNVLVDTNLLVYAYDRSEHDKQGKARDILEGLESRGTGVLSTQVLGEFYWALTRKLVEPLAPQEAYRELEHFLRAWATLRITEHIILEAAGGCVRHQLRFWDAEIWATAKLNQIPRVLSEDFQHGRRIEGVEFFNPFKAELFAKE